MAVDFKKNLADLRAKKALEKALSKAKASAAPNMNPWVGARPKKEKQKEPPAPDIREFDLPKPQLNKLTSMIAEHAGLGAEISDLTRRKKALTAAIKPLCNNYNLTKFQAGGVPAIYYRSTRTYISKQLLLANGVSPEVIAKCTETTESWAFKTTGEGTDDDESEG